MTTIRNLPLFDCALREETKRQSCQSKLRWISLRASISRTIRTTVKRIRAPLIHGFSRDKGKRDESCNRESTYVRYGVRATKKRFPGVLFSFLALPHRISKKSLDKKKIAHHPVTREGSLGRLTFGEKSEIAVPRSHAASVSWTTHRHFSRSCPAIVPYLQNRPYSSDISCTRPDLRCDNRRPRLDLGQP